MVALADNRIIYAPAARYMQPTAEGHANDGGKKPE